MNDQHCIICFEELSDCKLVCCNKLVHYKCLTDWRSRSNNTQCPHCRQEALISDNIIEIKNCYFNKGEPVLDFEFNDETIEEINRNSNNNIPNNMFIHSQNPNNINESNDSIKIIIFILACFAIIISVLILYSYL